MGKRIKLGKPVKVRNVGERFEMGGVLYEVVEAVTDDPCLECSLRNERGLVCGGDVGITGFCYDGMRHDNRQVVFKEVMSYEL